MNTKSITTETARKGIKEVIMFVAHEKATVINAIEKATSASICFFSSPKIFDF